MQLKLAVAFCLLIGVKCMEMIIQDTPPKPEEAALMARYIIRKTSWASLATISSQESTKSYPYVSLESISDGTENNSTGQTYLFITPYENSAQDTEVDNRVTLMASLAETEYCTTMDLDPQDPRCPRVMISGKFIKVKTDTAEHQFAKEALIYKHPSMSHWPENHHFFVAKIDIEEIYLFDALGGSKRVNVNDYYSSNVTDKINDNSDFLTVAVRYVAN